MNRAVLTQSEVTAGLSALNPGWRFASDSLVRTVEFPMFLTAVQFITELGPIAERLDHHPDVSLSWRTVNLTLSTHSAGGVTTFDLELAAELDRLASRLASSPS